MINDKDFFECLKQVESIIMDKDFVFDEDLFIQNPKDYVKSIISKNESTSKIIKKTKDRYNNPLRKNTNIIYNLTNPQLRLSEQTLLIKLYAQELLFNEPGYIKSLNHRLYEHFIDFARDELGSLVSIDNGSFVNKETLHSLRKRIIKCL